MRNRFHNCIMDLDSGSGTWLYLNYRRISTKMYGYQMNHLAILRQVGCIFRLYIRILVISVKRQYVKWTRDLGSGFWIQNMGGGVEGGGATGPENTNRTAKNCHKELSSNRHAVCMGAPSSPSTSNRPWKFSACSVFRTEILSLPKVWHRTTIGYFMGSKKLWPHSVSQVGTRGFYVVIIDAQQLLYHAI